MGSDVSIVGCVIVCHFLSVRGIDIRGPETFPAATDSAAKDTGFFSSRLVTAAHDPRNGKHARRLALSVDHPSNERILELITRLIDFSVMNPNT
jgi:hypothetical protein